VTGCTLVSLSRVDDHWSDLDRPPLSQRTLRRALTEGPRPAWRQLDVVAQTGSTNADVAQLARSGEPAGLVLVAESQTAGRGRRGREWAAPPRSSLTFSVLLRPVAPQAHWAWLGMLAAVAIADALRAGCGLDARLKWPNDVLVPPAPAPGSASGSVAGPAAGERDDVQLLKVAGLLSEVVATPQGAAVVVGIGINVSQDAAELPVATATSLRAAGSARTGRDPVLRLVLRHLATRYAAWEAAGGDPRAGIAAAYRERCDTIGRDIRVLLPPDGARTLDGIAEGVDDEGRLLVRSAGESNRTITALSVGDVVHIRLQERA
jgi:BirA family transcriptional regulator, biotin operon repressor / biotin---[acetyl-CoA-carboxylase] ligase